MVLAKDATHATNGGQIQSLGFRISVCCVVDSRQVVGRQQRFRMVLTERPTIQLQHFGGNGLRFGIATLSKVDELKFTHRLNCVEVLGTPTLAPGSLRSVE